MEYFSYLFIATTFIAVYFSFRFFSKYTSLKLGKSDEILIKEEELAQARSGLLKIEKELELVKAFLEESKTEAANRMEEFSLKLQKKEEIIVQLNSDLAEKSTLIKGMEEKLSEQKDEVKKIQEQFQISFKNLANDILEEKSKRFTEQNKSNISEILKPLGDKIKDFEKRVEETYDKESKLRFSLKEEVKQLHESTLKISKEATDLTKALKGQSKTRGNWGEIVLENILEKSGLVKDREYFVQSSLTTEEGKRLQPDVIIQYPGNRNVVIDSKVSLVAYEQYVNSDDEQLRSRLLKDHISSIKNHITDLGQKNYQDLYQITSLDFVMMFIPVEPSYLVAIQEDPELWNFAYEKRILLISPTNLIAALKMVASLWQQEYQNRNVQEIARQSGALYDKFVGLYDDMEKVGKQLDSAQKVHHDAMRKLKEGPGNLVKKVEDIKKLGAKTKKSLPDSLTNSIEE